MTVPCPDCGCALHKESGLCHGSTALDALRAVVDADRQVRTHPPGVTHAIAAVDRMHRALSNALTVLARIDKEVAANKPL